MREPVKRLELYEAIKRDIANRIYLPGEFLPNELELAAKYGYARNTVRPALSMLEDEKILELMKGKGRRICQPEVEKPQVPLTFLLPCADFLSETIQIPQSLHTRQILQGVSQVAFEHNCRVQTVPVSSTNDQHNIDWGQLDFIDSTSKVIVTTHWYCNLLPLLKVRGCKVVHIENQTYHTKLYANYLKNWRVLTIDRISAMERAVKFLADRGCERIALVRFGLSEKDHPVLSGYKSGLKKCGLQYCAWLDVENYPNKAITRLTADFYQKNNFDALILDPYQVCMLRTQKSLNHCLALPDNVKIMADDEIGYNQRTFPSLSSLDYQYEEIGRAAAQYLLKEDFRPGNEIFPAKIIERESTICETEQLTLLAT
ncbi:MAG: GntR family transcriptional regulator [Victivallaceae bacterium]